MKKLKVFISSVQNEFTKERKELYISNLKEPHSSYPHNPLLAGCMFLTGEIERFGTGTLEMVKLIKEKGLKPPHISLDEGFKLTIWRPSAETTHDTIHDVPSAYKEIDELSHRLVLIIENDMSRPQLMKILELKNRSHFAKSYLDPALSEGLIEMTLPDKSKSRNQKYKLTSKGLALKQTLQNINPVIL